VEELRRQLRDGDSALLTPVGDAGALAAALARLAEDGALRARLAAGGREVVARHGWDAAAAAHEDAYRLCRRARPAEAA